MKNSKRSYPALASCILVLLLSLSSPIVLASSAKTTITVSIGNDVTSSSFVGNGGTLSADGDSVQITVAWTACKAATQLSVFVTDPNGITYKDKVLPPLTSPVTVLFPDNFPHGASTSTSGTYFVYAQVNANSCNGVSSTVTFNAP